LPYVPSTGRDAKHGSGQSPRADLEAALRDARGKGPYGVLVCLSGGKDSEYLLYRAKVDYKLNVLAFTVDANIPDVAWSNVRLAVEKLGVDHLVSRPSAECNRRLFRFSLQNQEEPGAQEGSRESRA